MEKEAINRILNISIGLTIAGFLAFIFAGVNMLEMNGIRRLSIIFSAITLFWAFYFKYGWKWPVIKHIIYKKNLTGTWLGEYKSFDSLNDITYQGEIVLNIEQSFLNMTVTSYTQKYIAFSYGEVMISDPKSERTKLLYLYSQNQYDPTDLSARKGTSELHLLEEENKERLYGDFWTNHNSKGKLNLYKVTQSNIQSFESAKSVVNGK
jgi:SMODS-associating 2TM, beta-strand rich effector domain